MRTLSIVRVFTLLAASAALAAGQSKQFHRTVPLAADGQVSLDTYKGSIRVSTWDRAEVQVDARIEADGGWIPTSLDFADVRVESRAGHVTIQSEFARGRTPFGWGSQPNFHYTIRMPRTARLRIDDYKSESQVDGLAADLDLKTYKGSVRVRALEGALRVDTYKGDVHAAFARMAGMSRVDTYKGDIELEVPRGAGFDLRTNLERKARLDSDFRPSKGAVNGGGPGLTLKSYKGSFRLSER